MPLPSSPVLSANSPRQRHAHLLALPPTTHIPSTTACSCTRHKSDATGACSSQGCVCVYLLLQPYLYTALKYRFSSKSPAKPCSVALTPTKTHQPHHRTLGSAAESHSHHTKTTYTISLLLLTTTYISPVAHPQLQNLLFPLSSTHTRTTSSSTYQLPPVHYCTLALPHNSRAIHARPSLHLLHHHHHHHHSPLRSPSWG